MDRFRIIALEKIIKSKNLNIEDHQAATEMVYGRLKRVDGEITFTDITRYPADCVNPPEGAETVEWIKAGMPGAECN